MKHTPLILFLLIAIFFVSCGDKKEEDIPIPPPPPPAAADTERTVLMYLPWSSNLLSFFQNNIGDMEKVIKQGVLKNERVLVFLHTTTTEASLFELQYNNGEVKRNTIKNYKNHPHTTAEGITAILNDVTDYAPAKRYAMTVGCHGMGWIPVSRSGGTYFRPERILGI